MNVTFSEFQKKIQKGSIYPITILFGNEPFLAKQTLTSIKKSAGKTADAVDVITYSAPDTTVAGVLDELNTPPFLAKKKLLVIEDAQRLWNDVLKKIKKAKDTFRIPSFSALILTIPEKISRARLSKDIDKMTAMVACSRLYGKHLAHWIKEIAKAHGKNISSKGTMQLTEYFGNDLDKINQTVENLSLYVGTRSVIEDTDVIALAGSFSIENKYELYDALAAKNAPKALEILRGLVNTGTKPQQLLSGLMIPEFRKLWHARVMQTSGVPPEEIAKEFRVDRFRIIKEKFFNTLERFSEETLGQIAKKLLRADLALKTSRIDENVLIPQLVIELCSHHERS